MKTGKSIILILTVIMVVLFSSIAFILLRNNQTVNAVVPNGQIVSGETITPDMLTTIEVPADTPPGFITDSSLLIGHKLKITTQDSQLIYLSDIMTSWDDVIYGFEIPEDYIITVIQIPNNRAVGGVISVGDSVDILGVTKSLGVGYEPVWEAISAVLEPIGESSYGWDGIYVYWVLANVKILQASNINLAANDNSFANIISDNDTTNSDTINYIVSLSYADYQKLNFAQKYIDIWLNISPIWNNDNPPLLELMQYNELVNMMDTQTQVILDQITDSNGNIAYEVNQDKLIAIDEVKNLWIERFDKDNRDNITINQLLKFFDFFNLEVNQEYIDNILVDDNLYIIGQYNIAEFIVDSINETD